MPIKTPRKTGDQYRQERYGITPAEFALLLAQQGGVCAICGRRETATRNGRVRKLCVDHDHATKKVRGLLCQSCNRGLGFFKDDATLLARAANYLVKRGSYRKVSRTKAVSR